jgi:hypothetical protein
MEKIGLICLLWFSSIQANTIEKDCLACHKAQQIPSGLIYRRYLMRYSTHDAMEKAIAKYLKRPKKTHSIMPPQFFLKFPMKEAIEIENKRLHEDIKVFLETFDIKKKLILQSSFTQ